MEKNLTLTSKPGKNEKALSPGLHLSLLPVYGCKLTCGLRFCCRKSPATTDYQLELRAKTNPSLSCLCQGIVTAQGKRLLSPGSAPHLKHTWHALKALLQVSPSLSSHGVLALPNLPPYLKAASSPFPIPLFLHKQFISCSQVCLPTHASVSVQGQKNVIHLPLDRSFLVRIAGFCIR